MDSTTSYLRRSLLLWELLRIPFTITFFTVACLSLVSYLRYLPSHLFSNPLEIFSLFLALCYFSFITTLFFNWLPILDCLLHIFFGFSLNYIRYILCFALAVLLGWFCLVIIPIAWFFFIGSVYRG